ncbi:hypothetical protein CEXT_611681 [Caerostris extrusa]|uniref:Uncharacterized protein n=1 Tax=Caerostris extrusa TaxID=172846 RepID=A0AAV4TTJ3_CAEEX|nr:hypothetical protein CEXT_611681 [Caerostris extrusa]
MNLLRNRYRAMLFNVPNSLPSMLSTAISSKTHEPLKPIPESCGTKNFTRLTQRKHGAIPSHSKAFLSSFHFRYALTRRSRRRPREEIRNLSGVKFEQPRDTAFGHKLGNRVSPHCLAAAVPLAYIRFASQQ